MSTTGAGAPAAAGVRAVATALVLAAILSAWAVAARYSSLAPDAAQLGSGGGTDDPTDGNTPGPTDGNTPGPTDGDTPGPTDGGTPGPTDGGPASPTDSGTSDPTPTVRLVVLVDEEGRVVVQPDDVTVAHLTEVEIVNHTEGRCELGPDLPEVISGDPDLEPQGSVILRAPAMNMDLKLDCRNVEAGTSTFYVRTRA